MVICQVYMFYIIVLEMVNWTYNLVKFLKLAIIHAVNCSEKFLDRTGLPLQKNKVFCIPLYDNCTKPITCV